MDFSDDLSYLAAQLGKEKEKEIILTPDKIKGYSKDDIGLGRMMGIMNGNEEFGKMVQKFFPTMKSFKAFFTLAVSKIPSDIDFAAADLKKATQLSHAPSTDLDAALETYQRDVEIVTPLNADQILGRCPYVVWQHPASPDSRLIDIVVVSTGRKVSVDVSSNEALFNSVASAIDMITPLSTTKYIITKYDVQLCQITMAINHFFKVTIDGPNVTYEPKNMSINPPGVTADYVTLTAILAKHLGGVCAILSQVPFDAGKVKVNELYPLVYYHLTLLEASVLQDVRKFVSTSALIFQRYVQCDTPEVINMKVDHAVQQLALKKYNDSMFYAQKEFLTACSQFRSTDKKGDHVTNDSVMDCFFPHQKSQRWGGVARLDAFIRFREGLIAKNPTFEFKHIAIAGQGSDICAHVIKLYYDYIKKPSPTFKISQKTATSISDSEVGRIEWAKGENIALKLQKLLPDESTSLLYILDYVPEQYGFFNLNKGADSSTLHILLKTLAANKVSVIAPHHVCLIEKFTMVADVMLDRGHAIKYLPHPRAHNDSYSYCFSTLDHEGGVRKAIELVRGRITQCLEIIARNKLRNHLMTFGHHFPPKPMMDWPLTIAYAINMSVRYEAIEMKTDAAGDARAIMDKHYTDPSRILQHGKRPMSEQEQMALAIAASLTVETPILPADPMIPADNNNQQPPPPPPVVDPPATDLSGESSQEGKEEEELYSPKNSKKGKSNTGDKLYRTRSNSKSGNP